MNLMDAPANLEGVDFFYYCKLGWFSFPKLRTFEQPSTFSETSSDLLISYILGNTSLRLRLLLDPEFPQLFCSIFDEALLSSPPDAT